jgi:acetyltransferase-like isoleucine patch superfamily enzyme
MVLVGTIVKGLGFASTLGGLPALLPHFERQYDELRGAHPATINVDVNQAIDVGIDFSTDELKIGDDVSRFEFVRVMFEYPLATRTKGWIFQPYGYHWGALKHKSIVEILLSEYLGGVIVGNHCRIHILNEHWGSSSTSPHYLKEYGDGR